MGYGTHHQNTNAGLSESKLVGDLWPRVKPATLGDLPGLTRRRWVMSDTSLGYIDSTTRTLFAATTWALATEG